MPRILENTKNTKLSYNHFQLRDYDFVIGRWMNPDPYRQYASPYVAFGNNPVNRVDPDGGTDGPPVINVEGGDCFCSRIEEGFYITYNAQELGRTADFSYANFSVGILDFVNDWINQNPFEAAEWYGVSFMGDFGSNETLGEMINSKNVNIIQDFSLPIFGTKNFKLSRNESASPSKSIFESFKNGGEIAEKFHNVWKRIMNVPPPDSIIIQMPYESSPGVRRILNSGGFGRRREKGVTAEDSLNHKIHIR